MPHYEMQVFFDGDTIVREGVKGDRSFKILKGEVRIYKKNTEGLNVQVATLGAGEIFGEMYLLDPRALRTATVIAHGEVHAEIIPEQQMRALLMPLNLEITELLHSYNHRLQELSDRFASAQHIERITLDTNDTQPAAGRYTSIESLR